MEKLIVIMTTVENREDAERIAHTLVDKHLGACIQIIGPITSVYRWEGSVETAGEFLCLIKTRESRYQDVENSIKQIHPYDTPEIIAVPVVQASEGYAGWLLGETEIT